MMKTEMYKIIVCIGMLAMLLTGCGMKTKPIEGIKDYAMEVEEIVIPEDVKIIALGEATHGNKELQKLKKEVFQVLLENEECRVFALEADFGGAYRVNEYIHGGAGTAQEAAAELGFGLYRTDEMADLIEWLRMYNETVKENEQICFYGFDMQRYDNNKKSCYRIYQK